MFLLAIAVLPGAALVVRAKEKVRKPAKSMEPRIAIRTTTESSGEGTDSDWSTTIYNVSDLLTTIQREEHTSEAESGAILVSLLTSSVAGPWESSGNKSAKGAASWTKEGLLIRQTANSHKQIRKQLQFWKENGVQQLAIEVRMISGSEKVMAAVPAKWNVIDAGAEVDAPDSLADRGADSESNRSRVESVIEKTHPAMYAILDEPATTNLLRDAQADARTNVIQAPKITLNNGQSSRVESLTKRPFVVAVRPVGEDAHEPLIRVVDVGWKLRLCPKVSRDGSLNLDFGMALSDVRSVETFDLPTSRPQKTTVQVPEVATTRIEATVAMKVDQTLVIRSHQSGEENSQPLWMLVKVRRVSAGVNHSASAAESKIASDSHANPLTAMQEETRSLSGLEFIKGWQIRFFPRSAGTQWHARTHASPSGKGTDCQISGGIRVEAKAADSELTPASFLVEADELAYSSDSQSLQFSGNVHFHNAQSEARCQRLRVRFPGPSGGGRSFAENGPPTFQLEVDHGEMLSLTQDLRQKKPVANSPYAEDDPLSEPLIEKVYPVADLVIPVTTEPNVISLDGKLTENIPRPRLKPDAESLVNLVTSTVRPDSWKGVGGLGTISLSENTLSLVIAQSPANHKRIAELFKQLRCFQDVQILYTLERLQVNGEKMERWAGDIGGEKVDFVNSKIHSVSLSSKDLRKFRDSLEPKPLGNCPKITVFNGQQIEISHREFVGPRIIPGLQLLGVIAADVQALRFTIGAGSGDGQFKKDAKSEFVTAKHGDSVLIDVTNECWESNEKPATRVVYLLTPRMLMITETEMQTPMSSPRK
jgi:Type II secretory pathway, component PulD